MESDKTRRGLRFTSTRMVWVVVALVAISCSVLTIRPPAAFAQDAPLSNQEYFNLFQSAFNFILQNYVDEVDPNILYEGAMQGLFNSLGDPYSSFLTEAMMQDLTDTTTGKFGGLGLYISKPAEFDPKSGKKPFVEVVSPIEDTPGWRAGIMPGDYITHINDEPTEPMLMDEVLSKLRGVPNTPVTITILRGESLVFKETIVRALIEVPTVKKAMLPGNYGYLRIIEFTPQTVERVRDSINFFKSNNYKGMVIDLRNNPGGLLQSAIQVADLFLPSGVIVSTRSRNAYENTAYRARSTVAVPADMPIIVLLNKGSASASEILAGALKDHKRAYLVGENSYGKGSVQQVLPLGETGFKLTMSRYYTPSDANIDKLGIAPDLEVLEPVLSPEEEASLNELLEQNTFRTFAAQNPEADEAAVNRFAASLQAKGSPVSTRVLKRLIHNELNRTRIVAEFDLDYDLQLQAALEVLQTGSFPSLVSQVLSVKELQARQTVQP
ncbi:MAG: S41 family peptidase [Spirochaetes bacterium]|nr:S41 family peptidase [Spirochaetota bacterium]MBU0955880.1 S41 family peptidase [Spirochaetota bacterium]